MYAEVRISRGSEDDEDEGLADDEEESDPIIGGPATEGRP